MMKLKSMCTVVGLIVMCLAGLAVVVGKLFYQIGSALSCSVVAIDCFGCIVGLISISVITVCLWVMLVLLIINACWSILRL